MGASDAALERAAGWSATEAGAVPATAVAAHSAAAEQTAKAAAPVDVRTSPLLTSAIPSPVPKIRPHLLRRPKEHYREWERPPKKPNPWFWQEPR